MALFSQNMLELACVLAEHDPSYEEFVLKFLERFFWIAAAMDPIGDNPGRDVGRGGRLLLRRPAPPRRAAAQRLKVRSVVGLLPLCATTAIPPS